MKKARIITSMLSIALILTMTTQAMAADLSYVQNVDVQNQKATFREDRSIEADGIVILPETFSLDANAVATLLPNIEYIIIAREYDDHGNVMQVESSIIVGEIENGKMARAVTSRTYDIVARYTWNDTYYCGYVGASGNTLKSGSSWRFNTCSPKYGLNSAIGVSWVKKSVSNRTSTLLLEGKWSKGALFGNAGFVRQYAINSQGYAYYSG